MDNEDTTIVKVNKSKRKNLSKIDVTMTACMLVITIWGYVAQYLIDDEEGNISKRAKFWIGMTIPISTTIVSFIKSVQVGMEIKADHVDEGTGKYEHVANPHITIANSNVVISEPSLSKAPTQKFLLEPSTHSESAEECVQSHQASSEGP